MTNKENKSAADVAAQNILLNALPVKTAGNMGIGQLPLNYIKEQITQAIQSENAALLASNVELTAEVELAKYRNQIAEEQHYLDREYMGKVLGFELERKAEVETLRFALNYYADASKYDYELTAAPFEVVPEIIYSDDKGATARTALSQPSPTGFGDKVLKVLKAANHLNSAVAEFGENPEFIHENFQNMSDALAKLTPEEIKLLEGYGDE